MELEKNQQSKEELKIFSIDILVKDLKSPLYKMFWKKKEQVDRIKGQKEVNWGKKENKLALRSMKLYLT